MIDKIPQSAPLGKRPTTLASFPSFQFMESIPSSERNEHIPSLITKVKMR